MTVLVIVGIVTDPVFRPGSRAWLVDILGLKETRFDPFARATTSTLPVDGDPLQVQGLLQVQRAPLQGHFPAEAHLPRQDR